MTTNNQMKILTFNKEETGWYIDLPNWTGAKADLAMVAGADKLLDRISYGRETVKLVVTQAPIDNYYKLTLKERTYEAGGGVYKVHGPETFPKEIWLCGVTEFVFGGYMPSELHFYPTFLT